MSGSFMADPTIDNARQNIIVRLDNLGVDVSTRHVTPQWREWRWIMQIGADRIIAKREGCSARKVNMTISLAFLAPDLVKVAIEGRLPRGMGVARLCDMPAEWSRQRQMLGLTSAEAR
jgi:hypothetical protein